MYEALSCVFLKLEEVAEERQTVVRCGGVNRGSVLPVATSALEGVRVSSLVFVERNVGGHKLNILVI